MSDPAALFKFEENHVVVPLVVLTELEAKRHHGELGWAARRSLRAFEALRVRHGAIDQPVPVNSHGGTVRVELNHVDTPLPDALNDGGNDQRILSVAKNLTDEGNRTVLVSRDLPLRRGAAVVGVAAEEYRSEFALDPEWTGLVDLDVDPSEIDEFFEEGQLVHESAQALPVHTAVRLNAHNQSGLGRVGRDSVLRPLRKQTLFGVRGRNTEHRVALDVLADPDIGIISLGGPAGTGKSVLALAAGLEAVLEHESHRRIVIFRPLFAVGGQELGYLPGDETEKMSPWAAAVHDALEAICSPQVIDEIEDRSLIEIMPLTHIRGRSLTDSFVIIDEAQNLERGVLLTALSRLGERSRVVLTHDVAQRDNLRVGRHDGVVSVIDALRGSHLFAHVSLRKAERSPIAALVTTLLDDLNTPPPLDLEQLAPQF